MAGIESEKEKFKGPNGSRIGNYVSETILYPLVESFAHQVAVILKFSGKITGNNGSLVRFSGLNEEKLFESTIPLIKPREQPIYMYVGKDGNGNYIFEHCKGEILTGLTRLDELKPGDLKEAIEKAFLNVLLSGGIIDYLKLLNEYGESEKLFRYLFLNLKDDGRIHTINIDIDHIKDDLVYFIKEIIEQNNLDAGKIIFELVESESSRNLNVVIPILERLIQVGLTFAMDDYKSHSSNKVRLHKLGYENDLLSYVKIDWDFTKNAMDDFDKNGEEGNLFFKFRKDINEAVKKGKKIVFEHVSSESVFLFILENFGNDGVLDPKVYSLQGYWLEKYTKEKPLDIPIDHEIKTFEPVYIVV